MTVSTTVSRVSYAGNGTTATFTVPYYFLAASDLKVYKRSSSGVETLQTLNSQYTVSGAGNGTGGTVTFAIAPASGETVVIVRDPIVTQETDYQANDPFPAETHERALDRLTMIAQRHADQLGRALVLAESDTDGDGAFQARGNRIADLAPGENDTDAVTLLQVQTLIAMGGGGGGGGGGTSNIVVPDTEVDRIVSITLADPSLAEMFTPLNDQYGNLAAQILALNSSVGSINTSVGTINTTLVDMQASIDPLSAISGDANNIIALITAEESARISADSAIVTTIEKMGAADGDNVSFLLNLDTVKVGPTETMAARFEGIATQFDDATASVQAEALARSNADSATAATIALLGAKNGGGTAFVFNLNTAYVGASESLGQRLSGIATSINNNAAAILSEQTTRANADSSMALSISTLQSTVGGHTTTIQQQASTINGIQAKYGVKIDNNGHVTGFGLISDSNTGTPYSTFTILADAFKVYNGSTAEAPFEIVGGVVTIKEANIGSLQVGKLIEGGDSPFTPKAWARFYSNLSTNVAYFTRQSGFATVTRTDQGKYTFTFASALPNRLYTVLAMCANENNTDVGLICTVYDVTTTGFKLACINAGGNYKDTNLGQLIVFGNNETDTAPPTGYDYSTDPSPPTWGPGGVIP